MTAWGWQAAGARSEDAKWIMLTTPVEVSHEQIAAFEAVIEHNNRPVQPLGSRALSEDVTTN